MPTALIFARIVTAAVLSGISVANAQPATFQRAVVLNNNFVVVSELKSTEGLSEFRQAWNAKVRQPVSSSSFEGNTFTFTLDVKAKEGGGRWLYRLDGYLYKLGHNATAVYKLQNERKFNKLLNIGQ